MRDGCIELSHNWHLHQRKKTAARRRKLLVGDGGPDYFRIAALQAVFPWTRTTWWRNTSAMGMAADPDEPLWMETCGAVTTKYKVGW